LGIANTTGRSPRRRLALVLVAAAVVTTALAIFGLQHAPNYNTRLFGSAGPEAISLKSKIATGVLGLALLQLLLALWIYGQIPGRATAPHQVRTVHRTCGVILFLATLPVAVHCMFAYGVQTTSARVTIHSLAGCFFYGVFTAKVLVVRSRQQLGWAIPVAGGLLVTLVAVLWYTSALWFFDGSRLPG